MEVPGTTINGHNQQYYTEMLKRVGRKAYGDDNIIPREVYSQLVESAFLQAGENEQLKKGVQDLTNRITELETAANEHPKELQEKARVITVQGERIKELGEEVQAQQEAAKEAKELQKRLQKLEAEKVQLQQQPDQSKLNLLNRIAEKILGQRDNLDGLQDAVKGILKKEGEHDTVLNERDEALRQVEEKENARAALETEVEEKEEARAALENQVNEKDEELEGLGELRAALQTEVDQKETARAALVSQGNVERTEAKTLMGLIKNGASWGRDTITGAPRYAYDALRF